jgi:hypothetical protein
VDWLAASVKTISGRDSGLQTAFWDAKKEILGGSSDPEVEAGHHHAPGAP